MSNTYKDKFIKSVVSVGKKNKILSILILPILTIGVVIFHIADYFYGNSKRFAMIACVLLFFICYSSFSFPIFSSQVSNKQIINVSDDANHIELVEEYIIDIDDVDFTEDDELLEEVNVYLEHEEVYLEDVIENSFLVVENNYNDNVDRDDASKDENRSTAFGKTFEKDDWKLILVNKQNSIPVGYEEQVPLGKINTMKGVMQCDERIIDDTLAMMEAAKEDGVTLAICSPYRDYTYQEMLFEKKINKYMSKGFSYMEAYQLASEAVTVPNASEHQIGLAFDIVTNTYVNLNAGFGKTEAGMWLRDNSYKFGFILRYPLGKEDITGIEYEPWHFRYVGVDAATVIYENDITLEEFWEEL